MDATGIAPLKPGESCPLGHKVRRRLTSLTAWMDGAELFFAGQTWVYSIRGVKTPTTGVLLIRFIANWAARSWAAKRRSSPSHLSDTASRYQLALLTTIRGRGHRILADVDDLTDTSIGLSLQALPRGRSISARWAVESD